MYKLLLYINTIRYLKWHQIYYRLARQFIKPKITDRFEQNLPERPIGWQHITLYEKKIDKLNNTYFLNHSTKLNLPTDWNSKKHSKLWVYNLHYFENLLSDNMDTDNIFHINLLHRWIDDNPPGHGNGWEPYPTSLRITNILKAWMGGLDLDDKIFKSIYYQASYLSNDIEKHLLGNHYFSNLKALLFAGIVFKNKKWLKISEQGLLGEIPEQILNDGANFELSPMYHSIMLTDMLDIYNLIKTYPGEVVEDLLQLAENRIPKMLYFMDAMTHPNGELSFFNDSVNGIAPKKTKIENYAKKLNFEINHINNDKNKVIDFANSGYVCVLANKNKLIFDASPIGPDYIPGHAHADTLSFELSIDSSKVFVNSGISEYGLSSKRLKQRRTYSHNTVEVDEKDSSEVWGGFRVARRAKVVDRNIRQVNRNTTILSASHNGYKRLFGGCIHSRILTINDGSLTVKDIIKGKFRQSKSRFYFHPNLKITLTENQLSIKGKTFCLLSDLNGKTASLINSTWHPSFGREVANKMLEIKFKESQSQIKFTWVKN